MRAFADVLAAAIRQTKMRILGRRKYMTRVGSATLVPARIDDRFARNLRVYDVSSVEGVNNQRQ